MSTVTVWVLVFFISGHSKGGQAVIDNISTVEECQRLLSVLPSGGYYVSGRCIEARKAKP